MARMKIAILGLALAVLGVASHASAELYRCTDASGKVVYRDNPHGCRGELKRHETKRRIQHSGPATTAPVKRRAHSRAAFANPNGGAAALWKRKKVEAEEELRKLETDLPRWVRLQTNCNRGADTWYTDEAGIKHTIRCSDLAAHREKMEAERARLRAYIDGGLEDECRRAGCLPGWIR